MGKDAKTRIQWVKPFLFIATQPQRAAQETHTSLHTHTPFFRRVHASYYVFHVATSATHSLPTPTALHSTNCYPVKSVALGREGEHSVGSSQGVGLQQKDLPGMIMDDLGVQFEMPVLSSMGVAGATFIIQWF